MPIFILEPVHKRYALSVPAKVACVSTRMWMWKLACGNKDAGGCIFQKFSPLTVGVGTPLPETVEMTVAIHRDGVSRMRAVYDHRIRQKREAPDLELDNFARHLPKYRAMVPSIAHHCQPQSAWQRSDLEAFTAFAAAMLPGFPLPMLRDA